VIQKDCTSAIHTLQVGKYFTMLIRTRLAETYSKVRVGKHLYLYNNFPIQNRNALLTLLFNFALEYAIRKV
jgi:hypothetical protein